MQALSPDLETGSYIGEAARAAAEVMNVGGVEYSRIGFEYGKPIYKSSLPIDWSYREKQNYVLYLVQEVWSRKPIELYIERNGRREKIIARFDPTVADRSDATKIAYGNRHGTMRDQKTTIDLGPDLYEIAEQSEYVRSRDETGKDNPAHAGVKEWHYFAKDIIFERDAGKETVREPYTVSINVKDKGNEQFVYSFSAEKQKTLESEDDSKAGERETLHARITPVFSITEQDGDHNTKLENSRIKFSDPDAYVDKDGKVLEYKYAMPTIKEGKEGFYADVTINGQKTRMTGNDKAALEAEIRELKQKERMRQLSRPVKILREANRLFKNGMSVEEYSKMCQETGQEYDVAVARALMGIQLRNGMRVGGQLSNTELNDILEDSDQWKDKGALSYLDHPQ